MPRPELPASIETLNDILERPTVWFNRTEADGRRISARLAVFAALRLARTQPEMAEKTVLKVEARLSAFWRALLWSRIGYHAVVSLNPDAPRWYARATAGGCASIPLVVDRDGLRLGSPRGFARELLHAGRDHRPDAGAPPAHGNLDLLARPLVPRAGASRSGGTASSPHRREHDLLREVGLGRPRHPLCVGARAREDADPEELARWDDHPSLERAILFYRMHLYWDGHREWNWAMRGIKGRDYVILADWAGSRMLVHRMINTSLRPG